MDELAAIANLDTFQTLLQNNRSDKKIKRPTKGGIVEKFDLAMKKSASDRVLNQHLPSKLRGTKPEKKTVCFPDDFWISLPYLNKGGTALCVQMDFMRTFGANTKCNNINYV